MRTYKHLEQITMQKNDVQEIPSKDGLPQPLLEQLAPSDLATISVVQIRGASVAADAQLETAHYGLARGSWFVQDEAVVGLAHRGKSLPCQDAAQAVTRPRTALVLADGAGSSAVSEIGSQAVVTGTVRLIDTLDKPLGELLDAEQEPQPSAARAMGLLLVKHAMGLLKDLSAVHRREVRDFRCTFLVVVIGSKRHLWVKVGDGAIVIERMRLDGPLNSREPLWVSECATLGEVGKGEFANVTQFLDAVTPQEVQFGTLDATDVCGALVMSDGASEKLVSNDGISVAGRVSALLDKLRTERLRRTELTKMFYEEGFCAGTTGDDRSLAMAACGYRVPSPALVAEKASTHSGDPSRPQHCAVHPEDDLVQQPSKSPLASKVDELTPRPELSDPVTVASKKVGAIVSKSIKSMGKKKR